MTAALSIATPVLSESNQRILEENLDGSGLRLAVAVSRFNATVTQRLLSGALEALPTLGVAAENVVVAWVPGAFELPFAARRLAESGRFDAVVCLGCVIKGQTSHNVYISQEAARGIADVSASTGVPTIFGVITPDTLDQALERAGGAKADKGREAVETAVVMANLKRAIAGL